MRDMGIVRGSAETAIPLFVCVDTVFVRTDFKKLPPDDEFGGEMWEYHEIQYDLSEYIQIMAEHNKALEGALFELTQVALGGDSEMNGLSHLFAERVFDNTIKIDDVPEMLNSIVKSEVKELERRRN